MHCIKGEINDETPAKIATKEEKGRADRAAGIRSPFGDYDCFAFPDNR